MEYLTTLEVIANCMPTWEFLLQKKGDESWLPLESPTLEILEGEYRIAAKSGLRNTNAVINIDYVPSDRLSEQPYYCPHRQPVHRAINDKGLLLVAPFIDFKAGTWQFKCEVVNSKEENVEPKSLTIEVLEAITPYESDDWDIFELISPTDSIDMTTNITRNDKFEPLELITLHHQEFKIKGGEALEIMGEAYLSGAIAIKLQNTHGDTIQSEYIHDNTDSDFFNHIITVPEQAEAQIFHGEICIHPYHLPDDQTYITTQSLTVICAAMVKPLSPQFPLLPFENNPAYTPVRRNIKFPELPEFVTLIRTQFKLKTDSKATRPMPNWNISHAHKIPDFSNR